ncbi:YbaK/EbsC family protein [Candidatus Dojkabacteria bacterium]|uniref:YbaK/EbsC family protein n=1 Tax=Candidatus Dojkabacteria bacterium TaxID=2099670 RepID=A0A955RHG8_9BACT|nr:YbaK/EbsC family protein [Candidatus Dojkabacteria bacterium]
MDKQKLLDQLKIIPELEELEIRYRFVTYNPEEKDIKQVAQEAGLRLGQMIKTLLVKNDKEFYLLLLPMNKEVDWIKLKKFVGKKDIELATTEEVKKVTGFEVGAVCPLVKDIRIYGDMNIMKEAFISFGTGVKGVEVILDKNDVVNKLQVTLGYFTKD